MSEPSEGIAAAPAAQEDFDLKARVNALQNSECTEAEFLREVLPLRDSLWEIIALIDQRYRLGLLSEGIFRSVKSKLARHAIEQAEYGRTVELNPPVGAAPSDERQAAQLGVATARAVASIERVRYADVLQDAPAVSDAPIVPQSCSSNAPTESKVPPLEPTPAYLLRNRYALECVLGRGGMGTVYKASDRQRADLPQNSRHVALKILNANTMARPGFLADLRREFYCAQALAHPNIVKVYELYCEEDPAFYTMELLNGELLSDVIGQHPQPLERSYAFAIIREVGAALVHAHSRNVVHGDLKPHNIMITDADEVRILDFGASGAVTRQWEVADALQRNRAPAVTLAYTCCELLDGQQTDPRDDLFALACVSYEMLAGKHPFHRLRSTEARDLGMHPSRPPGLTNRQWHALELGLSWHRETRSVSVRDWLAMFSVAPAIERLPPLLVNKPDSAQPWWARAVPAAALTVTLIAGLGVRAALHANHGAKTARNPVAVTTHAKPPRSEPATADNSIRLADISPPSPPAPAGLGVKPASQPAEPTPYLTHEEPALESLAHPVKVSDSRLTAGNQITLSADTYRVPSGETFAEITVRRSSDSHANGSFVWWTEPASARPGSDFVAQGQTRQLFLNGRRSAKLYIRIVPNPARVRTETFYVRIGEPGTGYSMGAVTRAAILIPPLLTARNVDDLNAVSLSHR